jgi:hypothetical protein
MQIIGYKSHESHDFFIVYFNEFTSQLPSQSPVAQNRLSLKILSIDLSNSHQSIRI